MDEEQRADAKKASNKGQLIFYHTQNKLYFSALKNRTKKARNDLLTNGKKSSRKLEKTQSGKGVGGSGAWDWEETGNHGALDVIAEEAVEAPADNPLVSLD